MGGLKMIVLSKKQKRKIKEVATFALVVAFLVGSNLIGIYLDNAKYRSQEVEVYEIRSGDTLWGLAEKQAVQGQDIRVVVDDIRKINEPKDLSVLTVGDEIMLPVYEEK